MRINDVINEEQISEIPVGIGARLATAAKAINPFSTSGRNIAQGSQVSNKKSNELYAAYYKWIGQRNLPTDAKSVTTFLTSLGAPPAAIQAAKLKLVAPAPAATPEGKIHTLEAAPGVALDKNVISAAFLAAAQAGAQLTPGAVPGAGATTTPASPAGAPPGASPAGSTKPAATLNLKQINDAIQKLDMRGLTSVKNTVLAALAKKSSTPTPTTPASASSAGLGALGNAPTPATAAPAARPAPAPAPGMGGILESAIFHSKFLDQEI